jgi:hypothetical protein
MSGTTAAPSAAPPTHDSTPSAATAVRSGAWIPNPCPSSTGSLRLLIAGTTNFRAGETLSFPAIGVRTGRDKR